MTEANIWLRTRNTGKAVAVIKVKTGTSDLQSIAITTLENTSDLQVEVEVL